VASESKSDVAGEAQIFAPGTKVSRVAIAQELDYTGPDQVGV